MLSCHLSLAKPLHLRELSNALAFATRFATCPAQKSDVHKAKRPEKEDKIVLSQQQKLQLHYETLEEKAFFSAAAREKTTFYTSVINAIFLPATIIVPNKSCDYILSLSIPIHAHVGMTHVVEDYVSNPKLRWLLKKMLLGTSVASVVCSLHFCTKNIGFGRAIREFWRL